MGIPTPKAQKVISPLAVCPNLRTGFSPFEFGLLKRRLPVGEIQVGDVSRLMLARGEVSAGFDCGIVLKDFADIKEGDVLETYATRQVERELA